MRCFSAETGTRIFAIINFIGVSGWASRAFLSLVEWTTEAWEAASSRNESIAMLAGGVAMTIISLFLALVTLLFSSLLMNGILKKNPGHIKMYFIFGALTEILSLSALIIVACVGIDIAGFIYGILGGLYVVFSLILYMVRCAYLQIEANHLRLNENKSMV